MGAENIACTGIQSLDSPTHSESLSDWAIPAHGYVLGISEYFFHPFTWTCVWSPSMCASINAVVMVAAWNIQHYRSVFRPNTWQMWRSYAIISVLLYTPAQACKQLQTQMPTTLNYSRIATTDITQSINPGASTCQELQTPTQKICSRFWLLFETRLVRIPVTIIKIMNQVFVFIPRTFQANFRRVPKLCQLGLNPFHIITNQSSQNWMLWNLS